MWGLRQELVKTKQSIYFSKVNNENNKAIHKNCSKLTIKTPERYHQWRRYGAFKVNFEKTTYINLVFLFLTLNKYLPAGDIPSHFYFCQEIDLLETCRKLIKLTENLPPTKYFISYFSPVLLQQQQQQQTGLDIFNFNLKCITS